MATAYAECRFEDPIHRLMDLYRYYHRSTFAIPSTTFLNRTQLKTWLPSSHSDVVDPIGGHTHPFVTITVIFQQTHFIPPLSKLEGCCYYSEWLSSYQVTWTCSAIPWWHQIAENTRWNLTGHGRSGWTLFLFIRRSRYHAPDSDCNERLQVLSTSLETLQTLIRTL